MIKTFQKRPVKVKAWQWHPPRGEQEISNQRLFGVHATSKIRAGTKPEVYTVWPLGSYQCASYVTTIHGVETYLKDGDWVIQEPDGVHWYPCKPDVFNLTYEEVQK